MHTNWITLFLLHLCNCTISAIRRKRHFVRINDLWTLFDVFMRKREKRREGRKRKSMFLHNSLWMRQLNEEGSNNYSNGLVKQILFSKLHIEVKIFDFCCGKKSDFLDQSTGRARVEIICLLVFTFSMVAIICNSILLASNWNPDHMIFFL